MESLRHFYQMAVLLESLNLAWKDRQDYFAAGNMFVYYSQLQAKKNDFRGPDVFVVLDTVWKERKSWVVWEEGGKTPDVVIELISPSTEQTDRGEKMRIYSKLLKVGHYYLFDPFTKTLEGYELDPKTWTYRPLHPDRRGRLRCPSLGLWLDPVPGEYEKVRTEWLRWIDENGHVLPHRGEVARAEAQRAEAEAQRAEAEAQRAAKAERELAELKARLGPSD